VLASTVSRVDVPNVIQCHSWLQRQFVSDTNTATMLCTPTEVVSEKGPTRGFVPSTRRGYITCTSGAPGANAPLFGRGTKRVTKTIIGHCTWTRLSLSTTEGCTPGTLWVSVLKGPPRIIFRLQSKKGTKRKIRLEGDIYIFLLLFLYRERARGEDAPENRPSTKTATMYAPPP